jgi:hypothetical protein
MISGTPTSVGTYNLIVTVTDSESSAAQKTAPYTITIDNPTPPVISTSPAPTAGVLNVLYPVYTFSASGGLAPLTWSETGALPPGLLLSPDGALSGTPNASGSFPITATVRDSLNQDSAPQNFTIQILAQATGFTATGSMQTPRTAHTATLLSDGDVLVVGGLDGRRIVFANAELFDSIKHTFSPTSGNLYVPRAHHTATLLCDLATPPCKNTMVLITGGMDANGSALAEAELFDPSTGTFTTTGSMATPRSSHTATLLKDGRVLVAGGTDDNGNPFATAELFDPKTGAFAPAAGVMGGSHSYHSATLLTDGRVLIAGGNSNTSLGDLFDPNTNAFTQTATGGTEAASLTATLLKDGKALMAGGEEYVVISGGSTRCCITGPVSLEVAALFDPGSGDFSSAADMSTSRTLHTATLLLDGKVMMAGGLNVTSKASPGSTAVVTTATPLASTELYDPLAGSFAPVTNMTTARAGHTATLLNDGSALITGGTDANGTVLATAELYH